MKSQLSGVLHKSLFDSVLDGLAYCQVIFDTQGNPIDYLYTETNKSFEILMKVRDVRGKRATETTPAISTSNPELLQVISRVFSTGTPERSAMYIQPLAIWLLISVYRMTENIVAITFQDITEQKQTEKNLENSKIAARNVLEDLGIEKSKLEIANAKEKAILLSIGEGLLATDEKGNVLFLNKVAEELLGKTSKDVTGRTFSEVIFLEDEKGTSIAPEKQPINMVLTTGTTFSTNSSMYYYARKGLTKFPVAITTAPVLFEEKAIGTIEVFRDITREREIDKAKSEFVSLASHQLRTPPTAINWYSEMLLGEDFGVLNQKQKEYLVEIHHSNQRMIDLVNALLSVSRIELGTFSIRPEPLHIAEIADDVLKELQIQAGKKELEIKKDYSKDAPIIENDENLVRIVLQNLLSNAIAYTPPKGSVCIKIERAGTGIRIEVGDSGCGIPEDAQPKIYTKFFRADNARMIKTDGTGLGLYITKSIVEALNGSIEFKSTEGRGTTFFVTLSGRDRAK